jgi:type IV pilus assembly protein PilC
MCENESFQSLVAEMRRDAMKGRMLSRPLAGAAFLPATLIQMVRAGEETARLPEMLLHVAEHLETEIDRLLDGLSSAIEPVLIVLIGVIVGGLLIALYLPIFELATSAMME